MNGIKTSYLATVMEFMSKEMEKTKDKNVLQETIVNQLLKHNRKYSGAKNNPDLTIHKHKDSRLRLKWKSLTH